MKIVREHINEIVRGKDSAIASLGIGRTEVNRKLKEIILDEYGIYHSIEHNAHGNYISKLLKLPIEDILECYSKISTLNAPEILRDHLDTLLDAFGQCDRYFIKTQRGPYNEKEENFKNRVEYYIWNEPHFIIQVKAEKEDTTYISLYCNENVVGWKNNLNSFE